MRIKKDRYLQYEEITDFISHSKNETGIYPIMFRTPSYIENSVEHVLSIYAKAENGNETTCYGTHGLPEVYCGGVKFNFIDQCVWSATQTNRLN